MVAGYTFEDRVLAALEEGEHTARALAVVVLREQETELQLIEALFALKGKGRVEIVGAAPRRYRLVKERER